MSAASLSVASLFVAVACLLLGPLACGPSFQVVYEGNARFEHCYALEESPQTLVPEKVACWRDWSERYTYGQTRDRIHYATARYVALSQSLDTPTDEAMTLAAPGMTPRQSSITAPSPTNAFAPPPTVLGEDFLDGGSARPDRTSSGTERPLSDGGAADAGDGGARPLPASACTDACGASYRKCSTECTRGDAGSGPRNGACAACEKTFAACMRGCFGSASPRFNVR